MDMHLNDSNEDEYLSKLDVEDFVWSLKSANVNSVVVKAKSHVGLHYWPSRYGKMHEGLKRRNLDYVGEMIKLCHENGISVVIYLSQIYDNYAYDMNPTWRIVTKEGETSREDNGRYGLVCPNNVEYRKYFKDILKELIEMYDFEGMFLDMPFWPHGVCYCHACRERFWKETGEYIPKNIDWNNPVWVKFAYTRQRWLEEFVKEVSAVIKEGNPNISIEHNFAAVGSGWSAGDTEKILEACDYAGGDYYGGYLEQTFMCKYYNSVTPNKPFAYITSRCDHNLYFHTVTRSKEDLLIHALNALVHNGAFSMCDAMNPDGTITNEVYTNTLNKVYETTAQYEKYVSGDMLSDVSIWYNTNLKYKNNFIKSPLNVAEVMREYNVPFNVIGSKNLKSIDAQVLSINDISNITDEEMNNIEEYIKNGGNVFVTGSLGHKRFEELLGLEIIGVSEYNYSYLNPAQGAEDLFKTFTKSSPYPIESKAYECKLLGDTKIFATLSYPYTKPGVRDFAAIHSNPPGIHTNIPGAIEKQIGNGKILWVVAPLELTQAHYCRQTIYSLINSLLGKHQFYSNAPDFVEIVGWEKGGKKYFSAINQQIKTPVYPMKDIYITIPYKVDEVKLLTPSENHVEIEYKQDETVIKLPELDIFHIIEVMCMNSKTS